MSVMNINQYVNPDFDKYHQFLSQHFKQGSGQGANNVPLGASQTQQVLSSASNQLTERKISKPDSYKTVMCQAWLESTVCPFAENCRFAHGEEELRPIRTAPRQNNKYKTKLCDKYTTTGICPYGNRCLFIHPVPDPQKRASSCPKSEQIVPSFAGQHAANLAPGFGPIGSRPHPSWPLESPAFYRRTSCDESVGLFSTENSSITNRQQTGLNSSQRSGVFNSSCETTGLFNSDSESAGMFSSDGFSRQQSSGSVSPFSSNSSSGCWTTTSGSSGDVTPDRDPITNVSLVGATIAGLSETPRVSRVELSKREERNMTAATEVSDPYDPFMMALGADYLARRLADVMDIWK